MVHTRAKGQDLLPQSGFIGISSGQQGMSPDMSMPDISAIAEGPEDAMTLSAAPMLMGPTMIPSRAVTNSSRWMTFMNLMITVWHATGVLGRRLTKMCDQALSERSLEIGAMTSNQ